MSALVRLIIADILHAASRPLSSAEIADEIDLDVGAISNKSVSANLGYMRVAGLVISRRISTGKVRRIGNRVFTEMVGYWTTPERREELRRFRLMPSCQRRWIRPRTGDMRQMLEDISPSSNIQHVGHQSTWY